VSTILFIICVLLFVSSSLVPEIFLFLGDSFISSASDTFLFFWYFFTSSSSFVPETFHFFTSSSSFVPETFHFFGLCLLFSSIYSLSSFFLLFLY
jgi:hypothetical protein